MINYTDLKIDLKPFKINNLNENMKVKIKLF